MLQINRKLVSSVVAVAVICAATAAAAQEPLRAPTLVGIWSVRREVQMAQNCTDRGTRQGDQLATMWAIDAVDGGSALRVTPIGAELWTGYRAAISGTQLQMTARAEWGTTTIFLSKTGDHAMTGTETVTIGSCSATRTVTAIRMH